VASLPILVLLLVPDQEVIDGNQYGLGLLTGTIGEETSLTGARESALLNNAAMAGMQEHMMPISISTVLRRLARNIFSCSTTLTLLCKWE
jgi:hypothetical protein